MPKIKLNFWSNNEEKKEEPKKPIKNEVLIRIFKRIHEH